MAAALLTLLLFLAPAAAWAGLTVDAPAEVAVGQAFLVEVSVDDAAGTVTLRWQGRETPLDMRGGHGLALLGPGLDTPPGAHPLSVALEGPDGLEVRELTVTVLPKRYPEQRLNVDRKYVELSQETLDRHWAEKAQVQEALATVSPERRWQCPFTRPVSGGYSSAFGLTRYFNDQPRKPHSGVDLRGAAGTPVKAFAAGAVLLAEEHYFAGNSVYLDHGQGLHSMYFHLQDILVKPGQTVEAGQVLGTVGLTGRVTGAHLHFGLHSLGHNLDPAPLLEGACP